MKNSIKKITMLIMMLVVTTSCFKRDDLEGVDIYTTVYPIEYATDFLYGNNSNVKSIYPAEVVPSEYTLTSKLVEEYSKGAIFIYNGLTNEKMIARDLKNANKDLRIIDVSPSLEFNHYVEEMWINPDAFLKLAQNIKIGFESYINNKYIIEEINEKYEDLKVLMSKFDVELQIDDSTIEDRNILIATDTLNFLAQQKYGYNVINVDEGIGEVTNSTKTKAKKLINEKSIKYIYLLDNQEETDTVKELVDAGAKIIRLKSMTVLSEEDIKDNVTYKTMMRDNIEEIKKEIYE